MIEDLSVKHSLITDMFRLPATAEAWDQYRLSDGQLEFFRQNGYLAGVRLFTDEQVDVLRSELEGLFDPQHPGNPLFHEYHSNESPRPDTVLFHALGAWRITPGFHDLLWNPAFTLAASQLLDGPVRFWHDQLFCKPARHGGVVAWHQDYSYWTRTKPLAHLTAWIALDDADRNNGCLHYVPRTHRWPLLPITGLAGDMDAIQTVLSEEQRQQFRPVAVELKKGEATFHHGLTIHGSFENRSDRPRRATVINVFRDGVQSDSDQPPLKNVPVVPAGQRMGGQFFPLLYDPAAAAGSDS
jgi:ectoine hydroxylase-related dioxygenase (phytanoyl-CoA dioxygenase family)